MVEQSRPSETTSPFPATAPAANPVFYRTYSRRTENGREPWDAVIRRTTQGLIKLGKLTAAEAQLIERMQQELKALPSGRWLWVGGTEWIEKPENFSGAYNCTSTNVIDWRAFGLMMDLAMMGCGTGAILEPHYINQLPVIRNRLSVQVQGTVGATPAADRREITEVVVEGDRVTIYVGDSRQGWVSSYQAVLELSSSDRFNGEVQVTVDVSDVRPEGEVLKGFGGVANPIRLPGLYERCAAILNKALGRQLTSVECCLLIDEAAATVVAGNIRRCLPEDALVHTSKGLIPIKDVQIGDLVQTPLGFRQVVDKFDQGFQDVYEIETNATFPRATLNHRQAVLANATGDYTWKRVEELVEGDRLLHNTQVLPGTITHLPADFTVTRPEQSRTVKPLLIPELTPEVAWLIGFTHGDGYVALGRNKRSKPYGRVEWAMNGLDTLVVPQIRQKLDTALALFGLTATHGSVCGENTAKSVCSSIRLAEYFHRYIKQANQPLQVPDFILQGTVDTRAAYLAGLMDSDGAVNNCPPYLVTTVYRSFVRQVGAVLSSLGIAGRVTMVTPQETRWQPKYNLTIPACKEAYNALIAPHSAKGKLRQGLKMYGFTIPGEMMRTAYTYSEMRGMGFQGTRASASNYERYVAESDVELDIPVMVKGLGSYDFVQTYDIEVEEAHCFYCDGYLTHNSAGMRQGNSEDAAFAVAKDNLWQQDADGNWRIDPERDALRMANHTRVYHHKPTEQECIDAVRKQFYSGEGAIQYAPEAIARSNSDLLNTPELKAEFLQAYNQGSADAWLRSSHPEMTVDELKHRLGRYGLNPCVTADTWVHTGDGPRQVKDLIGRQHSTYIHGELFSTTPDGFFFSGVKPVVKLQTQQGYSLRLTANHRVLKVTAQTQKAQYSEWVEAGDLQPGDRIVLHNHRGLQTWDGVGTEAEGWLLGNFVGDGCFSVNQANYQRQGVLRFWGQDQSQRAAQALALGQAAAVTVATQKAVVHSRNGYTQISSAKLYRLAETFGLKQGQKTITPAIEQASYDFYCGFLRGLFDADGSVQGSQEKGISVRLAQSDLAALEAVQRMLLRIGIASTLYQERRPAGDRWLPDAQRQPKSYFCKAQHELVIANDNLQVFAERIGFLDVAKQDKLTAALSAYKRQPNRERFTATVKAVDADGIEQVYDCTVPGPARFDA
ncbi:MAG: LAGLIDADG family homing endonuclease, partial [Leptodesmis sp.]|uniref:LAGLIDADG family homing endonuclease n=1 Tax=Leptodesmis sp. TaxID=3100501 RepID=UPI003D0A3618